MMEKIIIKCTGNGTRSIDELVEFQGNLKYLSEENSAKLRREILELGFCEPITVWGDNILNGHQRVRVLREMRDEGYEIPPIPVSTVDAMDTKEAKKMVLSLSSQYGTISEDGLLKYMNENDLDLGYIIDRCDFPSINIERFADRYFKDVFVEKDIDMNIVLKNKCPKCGFEW